MRRRRVVGGGVGVREVGVEAERRAWCPQVIAIGGTAEERENDAAVFQDQTSFNFMAAVTICSHF